LHSRAKFREGLPIHCCDIAIFVIFKMAAAAIMVFEKLEILTICPLYRANLRQNAKFHQNRLKVAEIWRFNGFSKWRTAAILDLLGAYWDHPRRLLGGLYRCAKFGWNRCSTFDNIKVVIFRAFGLKTPHHAPKILVFGDLTLLVGSNINVTTKMH